MAKRKKRQRGPAPSATANKPDLVRQFFWPVVTGAIGQALALSGVRNQRLVEIILGCAAIYTFIVILRLPPFKRLNAGKKASLAVLSAVLLSVFWWVGASRIFRPPNERHYTPEEMADVFWRRRPAPAAAQSAPVRKKEVVEESPPPASTLKRNAPPPTASGEADAPYRPGLSLALRNEAERDWTDSKFGWNYIDVRNKGARPITVRFVIKDARDFDWDRPSDSLHGGYLLHGGGVAFLPWVPSDAMEMTLKPGIPRTVKLARLGFADPEEQTALGWEVPYVREGQLGVIQFRHFSRDGAAGGGGGGTLFLSVDMDAGFGGVSHNLEIQFGGETVIAGIPSELE